ncbi:MAG: endonuclease/exonuclease/phosphatase family protein [Firmicutes bacterium]|nr:endonuclease/exonuclease/phosphatase family protein [Bacillota bacterium]
MAKPLKIILAILLIILLIAAGYAAYVLTTYYRIEDNQELVPELTGIIEPGALSVAVPAFDVVTDEKLSVTSWNIGFGAYTDQFSFFMDGGEYARGFSKEAVLENMNNIVTEAADFKSDLYLLQEVDTDSTRSYHIDQKKILTDAFDGRNSVFGLNYDSPYLFYPFTEPHGKSVSGLLTISDFEIKSAVRRSLPIQEDLARLVDLDRCYTVSRLNTDAGNALVLINLHLSAYTTDPTIANQQLEMLYEDIQAEYAAGNYVICGGDFNKDLLGDSSRYFGVSAEGLSWAQSFPFESLPAGFTLVAPFDEAAPVPSCRNADAPWDPEKVFQITVDGFIVSDNIEVVSSRVVDAGFRYSDHNPVQMEFILK